MPHNARHIMGDPVEQLSTKRLGAPGMSCKCLRNIFITFRDRHILRNHLRGKGGGVANYYGLIF